MVGNDWVAAGASAVVAFAGAWHCDDRNNCFDFNSEIVVVVSRKTKSAFPLRIPSWSLVGDARRCHTV